MPAASQQNEYEVPGALIGSSNSEGISQAKDQARKSNQNHKLILLIILMFLFASQVIVLLASSGVIDWSADPVSQHPVTEEQKVTLDDIKEVNTDFNQMMSDLKKVTKETDLKDNHIEISKTKTKSVSSVSTISAPIMVKSEDAERKTKQVITSEKNNAVVAKKPAILIPAAQESSDAAIAQPIAVPVEKEIIATVIEPDYIKYDTSGNRVDDNVEHWACVQDTKSGLMWEVKSNDESMRSAKNLYSWFDPDTALKGKPDAGRCKGDAACDTSSYIQAMNKQKFCGHDDWRLPTREEMMRLVNYGNTVNNVKIDTRYFPETLPSWYWTASTNNSRPEFAWYVLFKNGIALNDLKEHPKHIRLVRNKPSS